MLVILKSNYLILDLKLFNQNWDILLFNVYLIIRFMKWMNRWANKTKKYNKLNNSTTHKTKQLCKRLRESCIARQQCIVNKPLLETNFNREWIKRGELLYYLLCTEEWQVTEIYWALSYFVSFSSAFSEL